MRATPSQHNSLFRKMRFHPPLQIPPRQKDFMPTFQADQPDIRPQAHNFPVKASTRMRFAQADAIAQSHIPRGD